MEVTREPRLSLCTNLEGQILSGWEITGCYVEEQKLVYMANHFFRVSKLSGELQFGV